MILGCLMSDEPDLFKICFRVLEVDESHYFEFDSEFIDLDYNSEFDRRAALEECAEYYHDRCDGLEDQWPLTIAIHREEAGPELFRGKVQREYEPTFHAGEVTTYAESE